MAAALISGGVYNVTWKGADFDRIRQAAIDMGVLPPKRTPWFVYLELVSCDHLLLVFITKIHGFFLEM